MDRPRGYFGLPRDIVLLDGKEPSDIPHGVPDVWHTDAEAARCSRIGRSSASSTRNASWPGPWPAKDGHITIMELTG